MNILTALPELPALLPVFLKEANEAKESLQIQGPGVYFSFDLFGITFNITQTHYSMLWVVVVILIAFFILGRNLKEKPEGKKQVIAEWIVTFFRDLVDDTMGEGFSKYTPYIATVMCFSLFSSLSSLMGVRPPTADLSVVGSWGLITFVLIERYKFKTGGVKGFLKSFIDPIPIMLPFNILGEFANPVSQTFRHFGNIVGGMVIGGIVYWALGNFAVVIPAALSLYFDLFGSVVQAFIFTMLTMVYVTTSDCS